MDPKNIRVVPYLHQPINLSSIFDQDIENIKAKIKLSRSNGTHNVAISWDFKSFAIVKDYVDLMIVINNTRPDERNYFELIDEESPQKPRFNINLDTIDFPNINPVIAKKYLARVLSAIDEVMKKYDVDYTTVNNCSIFSSHGPISGGYKYSYHIVIDKLMHANLKECKAFYELVRSSLSKLGKLKIKGKEILDGEIYSLCKQFRVLHCEKRESGRPKIMNKDISYFPNYEHNIPVIISEADKISLSVLKASLISVTDGCTLLPSFIRQNDLSDWIVDYTDEDRCLSNIKVCAVNNFEDHSVSNLSSDIVKETDVLSSCDEIKDNVLSVMNNFDQPKGLKLNIRIVPQYDINEDYYLYDYVDWLENTIFKSDGPWLSYDDKKLLLENLGRCCRRIDTAGRTSYITKESKENPFAIVRILDYKDVDCEISYVDKDGHKKIHIFHPFTYIKESKLHYRNIVCRPYHRDQPSILNDKEFNIFRGFQATYIPNCIFISGNHCYEKIKLLLLHIFVVWAHKKDDHYWYILSWLAYPLRTLGLSKVVMMNKGEQGAGKSIILDFMCKYVYGPHTSLMVTGLNSVLCDFNNNLDGKLLVCIDETVETKAKFSRDFDKFKSLITAPTIQIEKKGVDKITITNLSNYSITTNNNGVKIENKDRRYYCTESSSEFVGNTEYFDRLASCFDQECGDLFYTFLREGFEVVPLNPIPMTDYKEELINNGKKPHVTFLNQVFTEQTIVLPFSLFWWCDIENKFFFSRNELYDIYVKWCGKTYTIVKPHVFGRELTKQKRVSPGEQITSNTLRHTYSYLYPEFYSTTVIFPICGPNYLLISAPKKSIPT